jgi:predicted DNA-binding protein with PD1-like motif
MRPLPLRLSPNQDLRAVLESVLSEHGAGAGFVLQGIGSLSTAQIRFAGLPDTTELHGSLEILTLAGSLSPNGAHLHITVADTQGRVFGGHVGYGCIVRTTAEILIALLPDHYFSRESDAASGYSELAIRAVPPPDNV